MLYYPTVTREPFSIRAASPALIETGDCSRTWLCPHSTPRDDRVMICGSPGLLKDLKHMLDRLGFTEGSTTVPGDFVVERAFVEQ